MSTLVATEYLKCGQSELRYAAGVNYTPEFENFTGKHFKYLINYNIK